MVGYDELKLGGAEEFSVSHPDPVVLELNRLQNQLKGFLFLLDYPEPVFDSYTFTQ